MCEPLASSSPLVSKSKAEQLVDHGGLATIVSEVIPVIVISEVERSTTLIGLASLVTLLGAFIRARTSDREGVTSRMTAWHHGPLDCSGRPQALLDDPSLAVLMLRRRGLGRVLLSAARCGLRPGEAVPAVCVQRRLDGDERQLDVVFLVRTKSLSCGVLGSLRLARRSRQPSQLIVSEVIPVMVISEVERCTTLIRQASLVT
mmetsp:Transcript_57638/g.187260  ORF Transcript_57638/g.187260 Transcript_57638/m.187260 type:complete len:203 (+) Transcript_57638:88-696(+)